MGDYYRGDGNKLVCLCCGGESFEPKSKIPTVIIREGEEGRTEHRRELCMVAHPFFCDKCGFVMWFHKDKQPRAKR